MAHTQVKVYQNFDCVLIRQGNGTFIQRKSTKKATSWCSEWNETGERLPDKEAAGVAGPNFGVETRRAGVAAEQGGAVVAADGVSRLLEFKVARPIAGDDIGESVGIEVFDDDPNTTTVRRIAPKVKFGDSWQ